VPGGEKRKGDAPQVSKVSNEIRVYRKPSEADPSAWEEDPQWLREEGKGRRVEK